MTLQAAHETWLAHRVLRAEDELAKRAEHKEHRMRDIRASAAAEEEKKRRLYVPVSVKCALTIGLRVCVRSVVDDLERKEQRRRQLRAEREHQVLAAHAETRM